MQSDPKVLLETALEFATDMKMEVFPLHYIRDDGTCSCNKKPCSDAGKHPMWHKDDLRNGLLNASDNLEQIRTWWTRWPNANVGVRTGNGILVLDVDSKEGLTQTVFRELNINVQQGCSVRTGREGVGLHLYFKLPPGITIPSNQKKLIGCDVKADGGYVIAPGSNHLSGQLYKWHQKNPIPTIPTTLLDRLVPTEKEKKEPITEADWLKNIKKGERDVHITRLIGSLIKAKTPIDMIVKACLEWNQEHCDIPLSDKQVLKCIKSIKERDSRQVEKDESYDFETVSFGDMVDEFMGEPDTWIIPEWLPYKTIAMLGAVPGAHKTWITVDMALAISTGSSFLGHFKPGLKGKVLMVQQEDNYKDFMERFMTILPATPPKEETNGSITFTMPFDYPEILFHKKRELDFRDKIVVNALEKKIRKERPALVILDPLNSMVPTENYMDQASKLLKCLKDWRDKYDCSFLIVHHMGKTKTEGGRTRDRLYGNQFLMGFLETGIYLDTTEDKNTIHVERESKKAASQDDLALTYDIGEWHYKIELTRTSEETKSNIQIVKDVIEENRITSYRQIMNFCDIKSVSTIKTVCDKLFIDKHPKGWRLSKTKDRSDHIVTDVAGTFLDRNQGIT